MRLGEADGHCVLGTRRNHGPVGQHRSSVGIQKEIDWGVGTAGFQHHKDDGRLRLCFGRARRQRKERRKQAEHQAQKRNQHTGMFTKSLVHIVVTSC